MKGAWIALVPASARPGQTVTVRGYIPPGSAEGADAVGGQSYGTICFGGCTDGLREDARPIRWSKTLPGRFTMEMSVPETGWIASDGPHPLVGGTYRIGVECVGVPVKGCGLAPAEASAALRLVGATPRPCTKTDCGTIILSTHTARPGETVRFRGWAPLSEIIGTPVGYSVVLLAGRLPSRLVTATRSSYVLVGQAQQQSDGTISGSVRIPPFLEGRTPTAPGMYTVALQGFVNTPSFAVVTFAPARLRIGEAPTWASLGTLHPLSSAWNASLGGSAVAWTPSDPRRLAACLDGAIRLTSDLGASWSTISPPAPSSAPRPYRLASPGRSASGAPCASLLLDPVHSDSLYASFVAENATEGMPPVHRIGYVTTDLGRTWAPVPPPAGTSEGGFAGFQTAGSAVLALFQRQGGHGFAVLTTADGGATWTPSRLTCPEAGPCLRFGPAPSATGGMGVAYTQPIEWSGDGGATWESPSWPSRVTLNRGSSELVALSPRRALLVSGSSPYVLRLTDDGGRTWHYVAIPPVPGGATVGPGLSHPVLLPSGSLLAQSTGDLRWILLAPSAQRWCTVTGLAPSLSPPAVAGGMLWYVPFAQGPSGIDTSLPPRSLPLSDVRCARTG